MADPTLVNGQITDAVTQTNVKVLGEAPAQALGTLYQVMSHAVGMSIQNAVAAQQQTNILHQTVTSQLVQSLLQDNEHINNPIAIASADEYEGDSEE